MKKKDIILIIGILAAALMLFVIYQFLLPGDSEAKLQITVEGEVYGTYDLNQNQVIKINDTNVCSIENGIVSMSEASCPDHLCMNQKKIDSRGGTIVCLPNRVVLGIVSEAKSGPDIDAISQ